MYFRVIRKHADTVAASGVQTPDDAGCRDATSPSCTEGVPAERQPVMHHRLVSSLTIAQPFIRQLHLQTSIGYHSTRFPRASEAKWRCI